MRTSLVALVLMAAVALPAAAQTKPETQKPKPAPSQRPAGSATLTKADLGFSLPIPSGWLEVNDPDAAAVIARTDNAEVTVLVFVQREPAPSVVTDTLAKVLVKMQSATEQKLLTHKFDVFLDRPALIAEYENAVGHYRTVVVPREYEDRSQVYYVVTAGAPKTLFAKTAPALDKILAGFTILEKTGAAGPRSGGGASSTGAGSGTGTGTVDKAGKYQPPPGFDRAKVIERILAPQPIKPPLN